MYIARPEAQNLNIARSPEVTISSLAVLITCVCDKQKLGNSERGVFANIAIVYHCV